MTQFKVASGGREIRFNCPFCESQGKSPDTKYHLYISAHTGDWICFRCGRSGRSLRGLPNEIVSVYLSVLKNPPSDSESEESENSTILLPQNIQHVQKITPSETNPALQWLFGRFSIGNLFCRKPQPKIVSLPLGHVYMRKNNPESIILVSRTPDGLVDYYTERRISPSGPKYMNPPRHKKPLFKVLPSSERVFIVEGPMDALVVATNNPGWGAFALLGKFLTSEQQLELMQMDHLREVILWLDQDVDEDHICRVFRTIRSSTSAPVLRRVIWSTSLGTKLRPRDPADVGGWVGCVGMVVTFEEDISCLLRS